MIWVATFIIFASVFLLMSVGVLLSGKRIRGSCGGVAVRGKDGEPLNCEVCPNRLTRPDCPGRKSAQLLDLMDEG